MEKRLGLVAILIEDASSVPRVNATLSDFADLVDARLGLPMRGRGISLISLVVEGDTDRIGALTGRLGKIPGLQVKSVLTAYRETEHGNPDEEKHLHRS